MKDNFEYIFYLSRNKSGRKGDGVFSQKKKLENIYGNNCYICGKEFKLLYLELEHIIPVALAGKIFNIDNLNLICKKCHRIKTIIDLRIISSFKKMKILIQKGASLINPDYVIELYKYLFPILEECKRKDDIYWDLKLKTYKKNRQIHFKCENCAEQEVENEGEWCDDCNLPERSCFK